MAAFMADSWWRRERQSKSRKSKLASLDNGSGKRCPKQKSRIELCSELYTVATMIRLAHAKQYVVLGAGLLCLPMSLALAQSKDVKPSKILLDQIQDFTEGLTAIQQG